VFGPEFLEADDVGRGFGEPREEVSQALVDVVDVESGELQTLLLKSKLSGEKR
jgi:hypothetical protein